MGIVATILQAVPIGLVISVTPGAALFGIIQTSISKGFKAGVFFALGIALSDIIVLSLCIWGLANVMEEPRTRLIMSVLGGIILISYGLFTFLNRKTKLTSKRREVIEKAPTLQIKPYQCIAKGFVFNFTNPFVWVLWIGILPYSGDTVRMQILFFACILLSVFIVDLLKSFFAGKIKNMITHEVGYIINRIVGLIFCLLGVIMIIRMLVELYY